MFPHENHAAVVRRSKTRHTLYNGIAVFVALTLGLTLLITLAPGVPIRVIHAACDAVPLACERQWRVAGQNLGNTREASNENKISPANVSGLQPLWIFTTENDVSATPSVFGSDVFVADWACDLVSDSTCKRGDGGNLFSIDQKTGHQNWKHSSQETVRSHHRAGEEKLLPQNYRIKRGCAATP